MINHSVVVISYNQEDLISQCIDSLLGQSEMPYEIIIADDCSTDRTFEILTEYAEKYPNLIKPYQNEVNLGIFANINSLFDKPSGDMIHLVAGDDMLHFDMLRRLTKFIIEKGLKCQDPFMIVTDVLKVSGKEEIIYNNFKHRHKSFIKSDLRTEVHFWDNGYSKGLIRTMPKFRTDLGNHADTFQHIGRNSVCDAIYFVDAVGYIYRENVGVTVQANYQKQIVSYLKVLELTQFEYKEYLDCDDIRYIQFVINYYQYILNSNLTNYFRLIRSRLRVQLNEDNKYNDLKTIIPVSIKNFVKWLMRI